MGGDFARSNVAESPPLRVHLRPNECPRCGKIAAAAGHPTFDEWLHCVKAFRLDQQLSKWASEWDTVPLNSKVSIRPMPQ